MTSLGTKMYFKSCYIYTNDTGIGPTGSLFMMIRRLFKKSKFTEGKQALQRLSSSGFTFSCIASHISGVIGLCRASHWLNTARLCSTLLSISRRKSAMFTSIDLIIRSTMAESWFRERERVSKELIH